MEVPQTKALELIGAQQMEITVLREALKLSREHRCEPCHESCCAAGPGEAEPEA